MKKSIKFLIFFIFFVSVKAQAVFLDNLSWGINLYNQKKYPQAVKYFTTYTINNPNDQWGYYNLAIALKQSGSKESSKYLKKAYELTLEKFNIEKVYFDIEQNAQLNDYFDMASTYFETGSYDKAESYADMMLKIDPRSALGYFTKAKTAYTKGEEEKARQYIEHAIMYNNDIIKTNLAVTLGIKKVPDATKDVYYYKALEEYFKGNLKMTKSCLEKYKELDSGNFGVMNLLTDISFRLNDLETAQKTAEDIYKINPNNIQNNINLSKLYLLNKDYNQSENILLKSYKINPNNKELLYAIGSYYLEMKDWNNSKKYFENSILTDDNFSEAYFNYIYSLIRLKEFDDALIAIRKLGKINPDTSQINYLLAQICILSAQYSEAADYLSQALKKENNPNYFFELADVYYTLGQNSLSLSNIWEAFKTGFKIKDKTEYYNLALKNYLKINDIDHALNILNSDDKLDKTRLIYKYNLYKLCKLEGSLKESQSYFTALKKEKPNLENDYLDLSEFYFEEYNLSQAIKIIDEGLKKYPSSTKLFSQKIKFYYLSGNGEKIKNILKEK